MKKTHKVYSSLKVAKNSGVLFIVGTSGATNLPIEIAKSTLRNGGFVVDANIEDNHFTTLLKGKKRVLKIREQSKGILQDIKEMLEEVVNKSE